jgi:hypothetical protein
VGLSWLGGCLKVLADNKELIPEFYFGDGHFLTNLNSINLGLNHLDLPVSDVTLPPWIPPSDPSPHHTFILKNREALESNHVSSHLHLWIDLIFGCNQRGEPASRANNLFQPMTYEHNVDLTLIHSRLERQGVEAQIRNFGQCPSQRLLPEWFVKEAHPQRRARRIVMKGGGGREEEEGVYRRELEECKREVVKMREEHEE